MTEVIYTLDNRRVYRLANYNDCPSIKFVLDQLHRHFLTEFKRDQVKRA